AVLNGALDPPWCPLRAVLHARSRPRLGRARGPTGSVGRSLGGFTRRLSGLESLRAVLLHICVVPASLHRKPPVSRFPPILPPGTTLKRAGGVPCAGSEQAKLSTNRLLDA